jgi:hypothetical protein
VRKFISIFCLNIFVYTSSFGVEARQAQSYSFDDGTTFVYQRPTMFGWFGNSFTDIKTFTIENSKYDNISNLALITLSTLALLHKDQEILDGSQKIGRQNDIDPTTEGSGAFSLPDNSAGWMYFIGDGRIPLALSAYMGISGYYQDDVRMMSVSSQLLEMFLSVGMTVQVIKHATGRESPRESTQDSGTWRFFPDPIEYQKHTSKYDAMPSGHMAIAVGMTVILADNYYEYKPYIWGVSGVALTALRFQMMNNGVHWPRDYPLAIAIGYSMGKIITKQHTGKTDTKSNFYFSIQPYSGDTTLAKVTYRF